MKRLMLCLSIWLAIHVPFAQCGTGAPPVNYLKAVRGASVAQASDIVNTLEAIALDNNNLVWNGDKTLLKVVTWKSQSSYERNLLPYSQTSSSENSVVWVTLAPTLQRFCRDFRRGHPRATRAGLDLRLKKRLGMNPNWTYDVFVEMWVSPTDIFRPCVDPETSDSRCNVDFGTDIPAVKNIKDYRAFYQNLYFKSYRNAPGVPWTGLGYTYDWSSPRRKQGFSEFILSPSTPYVIDRAVPTWDYCEP
ncbi:hypothetical protein [Methyloterricola oryzae]|uniref:hypothetical protein n=1 Tax=Methyloterricola oryzae TaxID=1495050 RepID=UPI000A3E210F|nr:hypothetical protein [Methyloterricola oryzae]